MQSTSAAMKMIGVAACMFAVALTAKAQAQSNWPARPIRIVVPSAAGAGSDIIARTFAERMAAGLKQPIVIDNRPGGSGTLATRAVLTAPPDGYTLLYSNASATVMLSALDPKLGIDFTRDLIPVGMTVIGGVLLMVNPQVPARTLGELIDHIKANPGQLSYGSWGQGSNGHLTMEWLKSKTGITIEHVPYKSVPTLLTELAAGLIKVGWTDPIAPVPFIKAGKLRAIAVNGPVRTPQLPDLATMGEQGHPFPAVGWQGVFVPAGTPAAIGERLHAEINRVQADPELKSILVRYNVEAPAIWSGSQFRELLVNDLDVWRKIVQDGHIKMD